MNSSALFPPFLRHFVGAITPKSTRQLVAALLGFSLICFGAMLYLSIPGAPLRAMPRSAMEALGTVSLIFAAYAGFGVLRNIDPLIVCMLALSLFLAMMHFTYPATSSSMPSTSRGTRDMSPHCSIPLPCPIRGDGKTSSHRSITSSPLFSMRWAIIWEWQSRPMPYVIYR